MESLPPLPALAVQPEPQPDPHKTVVAGIAHYLAEGPLYKTHKYVGNIWTFEPVDLGGVGTKLSLEFPSALKLYCSDAECLTVQTWQCEDAPYVGRDRKILNTFASSRFVCRNCRRSAVTFFILFKLDERSGELTKVGQWPPLSREADPIVVAGWDKTDKILYRKAMTFRHANEGIAALPYLRRVIETHIHDVLDLIGEANRRRPISGFNEVHFQQVRKSRRFSDKLDFAKEYLPADLTPSGYRNPIGTLYELISEGLHERTEEDCVAVFDRCKAAFEFVVRKLTEAKREDEQYIGALRLLNQQ